MSDNPEKDVKKNEGLFTRLARGIDNSMLLWIGGLWVAYLIFSDKPDIGKSLLLGGIVIVIIMALRNNTVSSSKLTWKEAHDIIQSTLKNIQVGNRYYQYGLPKGQIYLSGVHDAKRNPDDINDIYEWIFGFYVEPPGKNIQYYYSIAIDANRGGMGNVQIAERETPFKAGEIYWKNRYVPVSDFMDTMRSVKSAGGTYRGK